MAIIDRQGRTVDEGDVPASNYAYSGLAIKAPCRVATTANITLSGEQTIDGVAVVADDRVLVKDQSTGSQNGIYLASTGPWSRVTDMDGNSEIAHGTMVFVTNGSTFSLTLWYVSTSNPIVLGTTSITFIQVLGTGDVSGPISATIGNVATFAHTDGGEIQDSGVPITSLALLASPTFTGTPAAPTAGAGTDTTQIATTAFVQDAVDLLKNGVSASFDTLAEIATEVATKASGATTLTAGAGLTGGGDLSANRTFAVGAGTGIAVNADDVALAAVANQRIMANISGGAVAPSAQTVTAVLDSIIGSTRGMLLVRGAATWGTLALGASGEYLKSDGTDVVYAALSGGGDMLSTNNLSDVASAATSFENIGFGAIPQGRITLTSATPVLSATASAQATVYYTPYVGNIVPIYNGTKMVPTIFTELSQAVSDTTKSPAAVAADSVYDLFVWNDAGTLRCTRGPAWTNQTTRSAGTALTRVAGILLNNASITNGPAASRGTYVGTIASNAAGSIDFIIGGTAAGGTAAILGIWNNYNRVDAPCAVFDSTSSWTTNSTTRVALNASNANRISVVRGLDEDNLEVNLSVVADGGAAQYAQISLGLDSITVLATNSTTGSIGGVASLEGTVTAKYSGMPGIGFHFLQAQQFTNTGTVTYYGGSGNHYMALTAHVRY